MLQLNRILIGLDLTELDKTLIQYTRYLTKIFDIDKVYFIHVAESLHLPEEITTKYPNLIAPVDETIKRDITASIDQYFTNKNNIEYSIIVREGNPTDKILSWSDIKEIDLMILGKKNKLSGSGVLPGKLVKMGHCSVLFLPENSNPEITRVLVPVDFSSSSKVLLSLAANFQKKIIYFTLILRVGIFWLRKLWERKAENPKKNLAENS